MASCGQISICKRASMRDACVLRCDADCRMRGVWCGTREGAWSLLNRNACNLVEQPARARLGRLLAATYELVSVVSCACGWRREQQRLHPCPNCGPKPHHAGGRGRGARSLECAQQQLASIWRMPARRQGDPAARIQHSRLPRRRESRGGKACGGRWRWWWRRRWRKCCWGAGWRRRKQDRMDGELQDAYLQELAARQLPVRCKVHLCSRCVLFSPVCMPSSPSSPFAPAPPSPFPPC